MAGYATIKKNYSSFSVRSWGIFCHVFQSSWIGWCFLFARTIPMIPISSIYVWQWSNVHKILWYTDSSMSKLYPNALWSRPEISVIQSPDRCDKHEKILCTLMMKRPVISGFIQSFSNICWCDCGLLLYPVTTWGFQWTLVLLSSGPSKGATGTTKLSRFRDTNKGRFRCTNQKKPEPDNSFHLLVGNMSDPIKRQEFLVLVPSGS